jgi:hypothetical protein
MDYSKSPMASDAVETCAEYAAVPMQTDNAKEEGTAAFIDCSCRIAAAQATGCEAHFNKGCPSRQLPGPLCLLHLCQMGHIVVQRAPLGWAAVEEVPQEDIIKLQPLGLGNCHLDDIAVQQVLW